MVVSKEERKEKNSGRPIGDSNESQCQLPMAQIIKVSVCDYGNGLLRNKVKAVKVSRPITTVVIEAHT